MTSLKLPDKPTIEQIKAIALATIRTRFESDATEVGDIEPFGMGGWKTTYWVIAKPLNPLQGLKRVMACPMLV